MNTASLPFPVGARAAEPASRSIVDAWAAPRAADLVLDPWAAPVGPPVAPVLLSPWPAPDPASRIVSMPPPVALVAVPTLTMPGSIAHASSATELAPTAAASDVVHVDGGSALGRPQHQVDAADTAPSPRRLRARMWAMIAGGAAATAGAVTLLATVF